MRFLTQDDPEIAALVRQEASRIEDTLDLIAAENHSPPSVMEAQGSIFNTKTIEGYPGKRFHAGCIYADAVENLAVSRAKTLFGADHANVQPHSGTSANLGVYFSVLEVGDRILSMSLPHGGHLSHGHRASITSKCFHFDHYSVDPQTERIDYDAVRARAEKFQPKMIVAGASAYPRRIDYAEMARIAEDVSAYLFVDMAHIAGLVAANVIPSPVPVCDFVSFTCYKTLMGGRGGVILCKQTYARQLDRTVFPGCQGTTAVNLMAAKAVTFRLAMTPAFKKIQEKTVENAVQLAAVLVQKGYRIVTGGTDNHQVIVDVSTQGIDGQTAERCLEEAGLVINRNMIPRDTAKPGAVSGIRLGTAAVSTRGMGSAEIASIAGWIDQVLSAPQDRDLGRRIRKAVGELCRRFPVYPEGGGAAN